MSKDKKWSDLTKKEKDNAKATAVAAGCLIFWQSLTKAGKWSIARWWIGGYLMAFLYRIITGETPVIETWFTYLYMLYGCIVLFIFRNKFFK